MPSIRIIFGNFCALASFSTLVSAMVLSCINKPILAALWGTWLVSTAAGPFFVTDPDTSHLPPLKAGNAAPDIPIQTATILSQPK